MKWLCKFLAVFRFVQGVLASPPAEWELLNSKPVSFKNLNAIVFGKNRFVAVGGLFLNRAGTIIYSEDGGLTWIQCLGIPKQEFTAITFAPDIGGGRFVAVGMANQICTSSDGIHWTAYSMPFSALSDVTYGGGKFVAVGAYNLIVTSSNGIDWTISHQDRPSGFAELAMLAYGNGRFIAAGRFNTNIWSSVNGTLWTTNATSFPDISVDSTIMGLAFRNGNFYGVYQENWDYTLGLPPRTRVFSSVEGETWTGLGEIAAGVDEVGITANRLRTVNDRLFYIPVRSSLKMAAVSDEGSLWTTFPLSSDQAIRGFCFGTNAYVAVGEVGHVWRGANFDALERVDTLIPYELLTSIVADGAIVVGVAEYDLGGKKILLSTNRGANFEQIKLPGKNLEEVELWKVVREQGLFMTVGDYGSIFASANGAEWTQLVSGTSDHLYSLAFGNGVWVAVGDNGSIVTSQDGIVFSPQVSGATNALRSITFGDGKFIAVGMNGMILKSSNAVDWFDISPSSNENLLAVAYGHDRFVAVGWNGIIHVSTNAQTWKSVKFSSGFNLGVTYGNGVFLAVAETPDISFLSTDGLNWEVIADPKTEFIGPSSTSFSGGNFWACGGSQVWRLHIKSILLSGSAVQSGGFNLNFDVPASGDYEIWSSSTANEWRLVTTLSLNSGHVEWIDPENSAAERYYQVRGK